MLLGMGTDGHTASLFPGTPPLHEPKRWAVAHYVGAVGAWRGNQGKSTELAGDFIMDAGGIIHLAYVSRGLADRPAVDELPALLATLDKART